MKKNIILFGERSVGKRIAKKINKDTVAFFVDNNPNVVGQSIDEIKVISSQSLESIDTIQNYEIVITSEKYFEEISKQLNSVGISNGVSVSNFLIKSKFKSSDGKKRVILANTHMGTNMGDHMITMAEILFFNQYLPEYVVVELSADEIEEKFEIIKDYITTEDIIAISGGGYMGSLWLTYGEYNVRRIVDGLPDNRIIVLPQSIYFENTTEGNEQLQISREIYNLHRDLTICIRDPRQLNHIRGLFAESVNLKLYPDMVLSMKRQESTFIRDRVGICFRMDKEAAVSVEERHKITDKIEDTIFRFDMHIDRPVIGGERRECVRKYIKMISNFKYVITDRLHCMLLCLITGTPCIAFDNITGKLSSVYQWINYCKYINIVSSAKEANEYIKMYSQNTESKWCDWSDAYKKFEELSMLFRGEKW